MPLYDTENPETLRVSSEEYEQLRAQAEEHGQLHWFPPKIEDEDDLTQAQSCAAGSRLLDVLFGEQAFGDSSAREADERGEIGLKETLGMSAEEIEEARQKFIAEHGCEPTAEKLRELRESGPKPWEK